MEIMKKASDLRIGDVLKEGGNYLKVISVTRHSTVGQMAGAVFVKCQNLLTGNVIEKRFKPDENVEDIYLERRDTEFLYSDGDTFYFMDVNTYEQYEIPSSYIGEVQKFLTPNMKIPLLFIDGNPVTIQFPDTVVLKVISTGEPVKGETDNVWKSAILENNIETMVPPFIKNGDLVRVRVPSGEYVERVKG
jgi:elongation factor P